MRMLDTALKGGRPKAVGVAEQILARLASEFPAALDESAKPRTAWCAEDIVQFLRDEFATLNTADPKERGARARTANLLRDRIKHGTPPMAIA